MTTLRRILQLSASETTSDPEGELTRVLPLSGKLSPRKTDVLKGESSPRARKRGRPAEDKTLKFPKIKKQASQEMLVDEVEEPAVVAEETAAEVYSFPELVDSPPKEILEVPEERGEDSKPTEVAAEKEQPPPEKESPIASPDNKPKESPTTENQTLYEERADDNATDQPATEKSIEDSIRPPPRTASKKYSEPVIQVQCERCQKWRDIPASIEQSELPKHWFCEMNKWDDNYNSCEKPAPPDVAKGGKRKRPIMTETDQLVRQSSDKRRKNKAPGRPAKKPGVTRTPSAGGKQMGGRHPSLNNLLTIQKIAEEWVQCETCKQWRRLPPNFDKEKLPDKWFCQMNSWDKTRSKCSAPEEKDTVVEDPNKVNSNPDASQDGIALKRRMNYRELCASHVKHFAKFEAATNSFLNARYKSSSLYVPKGIAKKGAKRSADRMASAASTDISQSIRKNKSIDASALIEVSTFRKLFYPRGIKSPKPSAASKLQIQQGIVPPFVLSSYKSPSRLKITKPWKRAGGWVGESDYFCRNEA